jgi:hypothetical protein
MSGPALGSEEWAVQNRRKRLHAAEVALREAAVAFAQQGPPKDMADSGSKKLDRKLQRAARRYCSMSGHED